MYKLVRSPIEVIKTISQMVGLVSSPVFADIVVCCVAVVVDCCVVVVF